MSKRTERMSWSAAERINRKDTVIRQNNTELEELRSQYESLDICEEDKQVIDDILPAKMPERTGWQRGSMKREEKM